MCFDIKPRYNGALANIKKAGKPVIAYKRLDKDYRSPVQKGGPWKTKKKMVSNRRWRKITKSEKVDMSVNLGIHLYRNLPSRCLCPCRCPHPYQCPCRCRHLCFHNKWMKVEVQARDIVAINGDEMVCMKCTPVEEI